LNSKFKSLPETKELEFDEKYIVILRKNMGVGANKKEQLSSEQVALNRGWNIAMGGNWGMAHVWLHEELI
jgi:hypothetical protein